ncbi:MAG: polyketide synthase dehydratase domain-containing protein, partial [Rhodothermales bacterium]|nr:polyketide synthase dehydratase domain-containing protein [Rhodothermales bacterium]
HSGQAISTLQRGKDDETQLLEALCTAHVLGCPLDIGKLFPVHGEVVQLPHYPWQREPMWFESTSEGFGLMNRVKDHPLLGYRLPQVGGIWENEIDLDRMPFLADHVVGGSVVFPAAAFIEMSLAASLIVHPDTEPVVEYLDIRAPLLLEKGVIRSVRTALNIDDGSFSIQSRVRLSGESWITHVTGRLTRRTSGFAGGLSTEPISDLDGVRVEGSDIYSDASALGLDYGVTFQKLAYVECRDGIGVAYLNDSSDLGQESGEREYCLSPHTLDACFHGLIGLARAHFGQASNAAYIPVGISRIFYAGNGSALSQARIRLTGAKSRSVTAAFELFDAAGRLIAVLGEVRFRRIQLVRDERQSLPVYENVAMRHWPRSLDQAGDMPSSGWLAQCALELLQRLNPSFQGTAGCLDRVPAVQNLLASFVVAAIREAIGNRKSFTRNEVAEAMEVRPEQRDWLDQLLRMLETAGYAEAREDRIHLTNLVSLKEPEAQWRSLLSKFPNHHAELTLVGRCGMHLPDLLSGRRKPGEVISASALAQVKDASPIYQAQHQVLSGLVHKLVAEWQDTRPVRILELALKRDHAGTSLKETIDGDRAEYSLGKLEGSRDGQSDSNESSPGIFLNDSKDVPADRGFDLVVVPHLLFELDDPVEEMRKIRRFLAGGGVIIVAERAPTQLLDFVNGCTPGWWRPSKTALQTRSRLLTSGEWRKRLEEAGFSDVAAVPMPEEGVEHGGVILIARNDEIHATVAPEESNLSRTLVLLADSRGDSRAIVEKLEANLRDRGHRVVLVQEGQKFKRLGASRFTVNPGGSEDFGHLLRILEGENKVCSDIVHLMGIQLSPDNDKTDLLKVQDRRCLSSIRLVQALVASESDTIPTLWLTTARAGMLDFVDGLGRETESFPSQAPLWGLGRVIANEHRNFECHLVDLWVDRDPAAAARLLAEELDRNDSETEVILTDGGRYVSRMRRAEIERPGSPVAAGKTSEEQEQLVELRVGRPGSLAQLHWQPVESKRLGTGQVAIRPYASGLNFRDLMYASGLLPEEAIENGYAGATLGMECAGVVTEIGDGVEHFRVGDEVMGFAPACFSSRVVSDTRTLMKKPESWSFQQAATVPVAFFTIYYALSRLANLRRRERVLIHGAAGAVGIAAIQYAQYCGAEIFATAGSEEKRDFLRLLGVDHVLDSRTLDFADQIISLTDGVGVDVVLNSLSGESLRRSLSVLRPFGRFLELGKRDFYENTRIGLRPFRENLSYFGIDADQLIIERPDVATEIFNDVMELFSRGVFRPIPHRDFPASRISDAFRYMQRSEHIGKIVVSFEDSELRRDSEDRTEGSYSMRSDATYLVTGGLSGFGLATAKWMVERGAR